MNYCELKAAGDQTYTAFDAKVSISDYEETFNVVDGEAAGRSKMRGHMIRDPLGCFIGHKISFFRGDSVEGFDALWDWLKIHSVDDSVWIRAADGQTAIEYEAYYTSGGRKLESVHNGVNYWGPITVNFIPIDPQIEPI